MMLNLTPEDGLSFGLKSNSQYNHQEKIQLNTPPSSAKQTTASIIEKSKKAEIVNKYITEASVFILSFWKNPSTSNSTVSSLFNNNTLKQNEYERFTREILKRSRCSLVALQIAMFYLFKLQNQIKNRYISNNKFLMCPKKVFLICLILSFKFNYDSNYSFKSWSKISGLSISEIKSLEFNTLKNLDYDLNCNAQVFENWTSLLDQALEKIAKLIEDKKKSTQIVDSSLFSKKRRSTIIESENSFKRIRIETV